MSNSQQGYVAIIMVLVITVLLVFLSTSISLLSIDLGQVGISQKRREGTINIVEACVADVLLQLNETGVVPASVSLPEGSCDVSTVSQTPPSVTFIVSSTVRNHTKQIQVSASRTNTVEVTGWREL